MSKEQQKAEMELFESYVKELKGLPLERKEKIDLEFKLRIIVLLEEIRDRLP